MRVTNLEAINPMRDLSNGLSLAALRTEITATQVLLDAYNIKPAETDCNGVDCNLAGAPYSPYLNNAKQPSQSNFTMAVFYSRTRTVRL